MEETQETDTIKLVTDIDAIAIQDPVTNVSVDESEPHSSNSEQENLNNLFDQLKKNDKHIFVLSSAGKPIYTR